MPPLEHYRMLDLSRFLPGPVASHILADLGMEVVKIEEPKARAGMSRDVMTPFDASPAEEEAAAVYNSIARNKKSVALDLMDVSKRPRSQEVFYALAKQADVVLEGYRPGTLKWMGIDYETVRAINPRIIYCAITGYGQTGPYVRRPGHDINFTSVGGSMAYSPEGKPVGYGISLADFSGGMYAAIGIQAALLHRERTGEGQYVDVPMAATSMSFNLAASGRYFREGKSTQPVIGGPTERFVQCKDGKWLTTANSEATFWAKYCNALGYPEWIPLRQKPGPERDEMVREIHRVFLTKTRDEWLDILLKAETCVAPVNSMAESFEDPQMRHVGMVWEMEHPKQGKVRQMGFPVLLSESPATLRTFAPMLGAHTRELLAEAGYAAAQIEALERDGVVRSQGE